VSSARQPPGPSPDAGQQLDLFASHRRTPPAPPARPTTRPPSALDAAELIAAIPDGGLIEAPGLALEAGRRGLRAAVPALERLLRRFTGFGADGVVPEQAAAIEALATIGGGEAARAVARAIAQGVVQGPGLKPAMAAAARLGAPVPAAVVLSLLRHPDPALRREACRCVRGWQQAAPALIELLEDPSAEARTAAACALGRLGHRVALPTLALLLRTAPTPDVIEAVALIADEDCVILLARIARRMPALADAVRDALEAADHPRAAQLLQRIGTTGSGSAR
jgi:HEAT repeat protein